LSTTEAIKVALTAIKANKTRAVLTTLGVIIGVASVVAMVAIGRGATADVADRVKSMGVNLLMVRPGQASMGPVRGGAGSAETLNLEDAQAIGEKIPGVAEVAPTVNGMAQVKWGSKNTSCQITGSAANYCTVNNHEVEQGRMFTEREASSSVRVCVIGTTVVENLFGLNDPIGQRIKIKNIPFEVLGVLEEASGGPPFMDANNVIVVPLQVAMHRLFGMDYLTAISVSSADGASQEAVKNEIEDLLYRRHGIKDAKDVDFNVRTQTEILETFTSMSDTFTLLLGSIAAVSLLVGGIGVMNIMLVSVTERTREIGIRKAVGATRHDILVQFLIEALTLCVLGGLIGIAVGIYAAKVISSMGGWRTMVTGWSIALAFFFSAAVGVGFGIYPARKAARLHPIEALRYE